MPKKKGGKKGAKVIDGVATNEMTREQLMGHMKRMQMELDREREERNFFMLEREKLYALWNITLEQLTAAKTQTRLADVRMDENEQERENDMHIYKQRVRHLLTEQGRKVTEVRLQNLQKMKNVQQDISQVEGAMRDTIESKNSQIFKCQMSLHEIMRKLQIENVQNASKLRQEFCQEIRRMESTYERLMFEREEAQQLHEKAELQRTADEKSEIVQQMIDLHARQIAEMKEYFNEITVNNFAVISAMQQDLHQMRKREDQLRAELEKVRDLNTTLQKTITESQNELDSKVTKGNRKVEELRKQLLRHEKKAKEMGRYVRSLELSHEAMLQNLELQKTSGDSLKKAFSQAILDMHKRSQLKNLVLQLKLDAMSTTRRGDSSQKNGSVGSSSSGSSDGDRNEAEFADFGAISPSDDGDQVVSDK